MLDFHKDKERYFQYQYWTARDYIIPFLNDKLDFSRSLRVLEIGCAEAGVLKAFLEKGHLCVGIELNESRIRLAAGFQAEFIANGALRLVNKNIYDIDIQSDLGEGFDLIILKDVIEHIPQQEKVIPRIAEFLKPGGGIFFGFPPWYMPFGGHQQICDNRLLRMLPWFHLLPRALYRGVLKNGGESPAIVQELMEIKETGISLERFERIVKNSRLLVAKKQLFLTNPIYRFKFGLRTILLPRLLGRLPFVRNFYSTAAYYFVQKS